MPFGDKYVGLTNYLSRIDADQVELTFSEIEHIIGFSLPDSAYKYPALWSNSTSHPLAFGWMNAGYKSTHTNIKNQTVCFIKAASENPKKVEEAKKCSIHQKAKNLSNVCMQRDISCNIEDLISSAKRYISVIEQDEHGRFLSWEHCYNYFALHRLYPTDEELDLMCLHLAWYLASWGMLRGGAFLLQKDYRIHLPVVKLLTSPQYEELYGITIDQMSSETIQDKIMNLSNEIRACYKELTENISDDEGKIASDTLITKILLGTIGCTPAYDRYFKRGLALTNIAQQRFGKKSMLQIVDFYKYNYELLESFRLDISQNRVEYTPMKVIDMCLWQVAYDEEKNTEQADDTI